MRILYLSRDYTPHDYRFLAALAEARYPVCYLRLSRGPRQVEDRPVPSAVEQIHWAGGRRPFNWRDLPPLLLGLRRVIRQVKPDLVHAGPIQDAGLLAALSGFSPLLIMSWGFDLMQDAERSTWYRWITRYVLRRATAFTSDAQVTREKAVALGVARTRTVVFPWGVDLAHFSPAVGRKALRGPFTLLCNRSWEPRYGVEVLARAFVRVAQMTTDVHLMLLGDGSQANLLRQVLRGGGVMDRVHFAGQVNQKDMPRYYHLADLFVSPSHIDGSSVSLMEALACGVPALVSDIPANREWVADGENGWLFPDGSVEALAAGILRARQARKGLRQMGRRARRIAETRADWKKNVQMLFQAYDLAMQLAGRPTSV